LKRSSLLLLALGLAYAAWPLGSAWQLRQAIKARDTAALEARVDWPALRANLKPKIVEAVREDAARSTGLAGVLKRAVGGTLAEKTVDLAVTPQTLARILAGRDLVAARQKPSGPPDTNPPTPGPVRAGEATDDLDDPLPPRRLRWAFFETPTRFRFEAIHPRLANHRIASVFALSGLSWKLVDIDLIPQ
jgi:hypothetical protein